MARSAESKITDPGGRFTLNVFRERIAQLDEKKADIGTLRGEVSQIWKFVEDHGGNKSAMRMALKIRDMPDGTRNDFLSFLQVYCEWLDVFAQADMFGHQPSAPHAPAMAPVPPAEPDLLADAEEDGTEVVTVEQIDIAEKEGYEDASLGRDPGFSAFPAGTVLRVAYDRGYGNRMREVAGQPAPTPEPTPEPAAARGRPRTGRVTKLNIGAGRPPGRQPRRSRRISSQPSAAE